MKKNNKVYGQPGFCLVKEVDRIQKETIEKLGKFKSAIIGDGMGRRGIMDHGIKPLNPELIMCGSAITVELRPGDNLMLHAALKIAQPGDVIVVNAHGNLSTSCWGELTTRMSIRKGLAGCVIDGALRDSRELASIGFPMFCRGINPCGGGKEGTGQVNMPISCGGVIIHPGDVVVGDADGVVVIPHQIAENAIKWAQHRHEVEKKRFAAIAGEDLEGIYPKWVIPTLRAKGILGDDETL
ncbi:MAG: 4-carboxy-4-hydroxy-2-oxoadipate aldolase/oxaloacetate decarboxylase [Bacteroidetes bacterium]|nr:4-carboxy-4-hydroxy-2-oxoadipate aldolase/oxaloacetate decarboxylase [Bacteroidota bacterium]